MTHKAIDKIIAGMNKFSNRIKIQKEIYKEVIYLSEKDKSENKIFQITEPAIFKKIINNFGATLDGGKEKFPLDTIYNIGIHKETGALIISNKGATLFSLSPKTNTPHLVRHIGFCVYFPSLGIEFVNVGIVGNVYDGKVIFRSESACTPSFLFNSQRCNCHYQWESIRELAANFNEIIPPKSKDGFEFEQWVQNQYISKEGKHLFKSNGKIGFILMHLDTQNGMGSGYSKDEFSFDLYSRASMRHRGEYTSEQVHKTTMLGGFEAIGINPDPRHEDGNSGYKLAFIILDYLNTSKEIIFLTNNPLKLQHLKNNGYKLTRIKTVGAVNLAGASEAEQRGVEFKHLDIDGTCISFNDEYERVKSEITHIIQNRDKEIKSINKNRNENNNANQANFCVGRIVEGN
jgi:hypothetical protein